MVNLFISDDALPEDEKLFLQPEKDEFVHVFNKSSFTMAEMAVVAGFFKSKTEAKKNGWNGDVPLGFGTKKCGKKWLWWFNSMDDRID